MIFENHNVIALVVFCFRLSTCQKTDTCNSVTSINGIYKKYSDMMADQLNYSVRSHRGFKDSFILLNTYFLDKILPSRNMTLF